MTPEAQERRRRQVEALADVTHAFSEAIHDKTALLHLIATRVGELTGDGCAVRLLSADGQTLGPAQGGHRDAVVQSLLAGVLSRPVSRSALEGFFAAVVDRKETAQMVMADDMPGLHPDTAAYLRRHQWTMLFVPLIARSKVIGVLGLSRVRDDVGFTDDDEHFLRDIAHRAALAIDNAGLFEGSQRLTARLRVLAEVSKAFSVATANLDVLLGLVASSMTEHVGDLCAVRTLTDDGQYLSPTAYVHHADPALVTACRAFILSTPHRVGEGMSGKVAATGHSEVLEIVDQEAFLARMPDHLREFARKLDIRSLASLPLVVNGKVFGVFTLIRSTGRPPFSEDDVQLAHDVSVHAALAIANSRLLAEVRASERRFARLAESGLLGVIIADTHGVILEANETFLRMIGFSRDDLEAGRLRWTDLTPPEWRRAAGQMLEQLTATGVSRPSEQEYLRKDGSRVPVLIGAALLDGGDCICFVADLSDRKRAEKALRASEDQLRQAQKMDAVGRLAGGVAHDFNNVLSVILSLSDLLIQDLKPGEPIRDDIEEIYRAGARAAELTRQLLLFSRHQTVDPRVIDLSELLVGMKRMLVRLVGEDVDLTVRPGSATARVLADPSQVEQVLLNLVVNARDAMPRGGKLTIEVAEVDLDEAYASEHLGTRPGAHVMIAVSDSGIGMDRTTQARIFEPFFTTKPVGTGTGLGLATVFGIVTQAEGSIWVYSEPGEGTTFKVYFPRVAEAVQEARIAVASGNLRGTETILLVEDEDQVRMVASSILRRYGYHVIEARNAGEALLICERRGHEIRLLLSDVVMPQMSGPELAQRLAGTRPGIRVLCMSGYTDEAVVRHGLVAAGIAFLQKPLTPEKLARRVREVLDGPWSGGRAT